jgi:hypothetical protein
MRLSKKVTKQGEVLKERRMGGQLSPASSSSSSSPKDSDSERVSPPPPRTFMVSRATPLSHSFCFHMCYLSFTALLAFCLAISLSEVIPYALLHTNPSPDNMSAIGKKGRNRHNQAETCPTGLSQGLATPSLKGTGSESERRLTSRARILQTQVSTSASANSIEKWRSGQLGPRYLHIVTSRR